MIIYVIYSLVEDKFYVGKTTQTLEKRVQSHESACARGRMSSRLLYEAVLRSEHGWDDFIWFEIDSAETYTELNEKEKFWIQLLNTQITGYNIGFGGDGGNNYAFHPNIEDVKKKISEGVRNSLRWTEQRRKEQSIRTIQWNSEHIEFLRNRMLGECNPMTKEESRKKLTGECNPMAQPENRERQLKAVQSKKHREWMSNYKKAHPSKVYVRTDEHRRKISERMSGRRMPEETKQRISKTLTGREMSLITRKKISDKISGIVRSETTRNKISEARKNTIFLQFSKEGVFIQRFLGRTEVKEKLSISASNIKDIRLYPTRMAGGYKWIILKKNETTEKEIQTICRQGL